MSATTKQKPIFLLDLNHVQQMKWALEDRKDKLESEDAWPNKVHLVSVNALIDKMQQMLDLDKDYYRVDPF